MEAANINPFDITLLRFFNEFAQRSAFFDKTLCVIVSNSLLKGGLITALFWWTWFRDRETAVRDREFVVSGIVISIATLFAGRALALLLPFRVRPRFDPALHFRLPIGSADTYLIDWSSFPSDNAALYFGLATILFFISRRLGVFAFCHAIFVVCLPRIYLGMHYPTDILAGALLGVGMAALSLISSLRSALARLPLRWAEESPGFFYPCFYLSTFLLATDFESVRALVVAGWKVLKGSARYMP